MGNKLFTVYTSAEYTRFDSYDAAREFVTAQEAKGVNCSIVEKTLMGRNRGQEWTIYKSPNCKAEY